MESVLWRNGDSEDLCEEDRTSHASDGPQGIDRPLKFSLRGRIDAAGHQGLYGWGRDAPQSDERDGGEDHPAMAGNGEARESQKPEKETREEAASLAIAFDDWSDQGAGN